MDDLATDESLSLSDAADVLGVHYMTAYRHVRTGLLAAHREAGRWLVPRHEVDRVIAERSAPTTPPAPHRPRPARASRLADRLVAGDEAGCWRIVQDAQVGRTLDDLLIGLLCGALRLVGDRWEAGSIGIADEHRATVVAMRLIGRLGPGASRRGRRRGSVVLTASPGDRHALPTAVVADLLRSRGVAVIDLGADTPPQEVASAAAAVHRLLAVGLCATTDLDADREADLRSAIHLVREVSDAPILLGGAAVHGGEHATALGADRWTADAHELVGAVVGRARPEGDDRRVTAARESEAVR